MLLDWRQRVEMLARQAAPQTLPKTDEVAIRTRFFLRRRGWEKEKSRLEQKKAKKIEHVRRRFAELATELPKQERQAREQHQRQAEAVRKRYQARQARLQAERTEIDKQAALFLAEVDREAVIVRKQLAQLNWERSNMERQLRQYEGIDFPSYLRRVVLPSQV